MRNDTEHLLSSARNADRLRKAVAELEDVEGNLRKAVALNLLGFGPDLGPLGRDEMLRHTIALSDCNKAIEAAAKLSFGDMP